MKNLYMDWKTDYTVQGVYRGFPTLGQCDRRRFHEIRLYF